jgi:hypothetical protein
MELMHASKLDVNALSRLKYQLTDTGTCGLLSRKLKHVKE